MAGELYSAAVEVRGQEIKIATIKMDSDILLIHDVSRPIVEASVCTYSTGPILYFLSEEGQMDEDTLFAMEKLPISCCEGASRLLLQALGSGPQGPLAALRVLQNCTGPFPWRNILDMLCMEVPTLDGPDQELKLKPALLLLPLHTQRNLFSFLNFVHPPVPLTCLHRLAGAVSGENSSSDPWLLTLSRQLLTDHEALLHPVRPQVLERLQVLCREICQPVDGHSKLGWCRKPLSQSPHKRKMLSEDGSHCDEDGGPHVKRFCSEGLSVCSPSVCTPEEEQQVIPADCKPEKQELPEHIKVRIPRIKELLHGDLDSETWDDASQRDLQEMCESCDPAQLQSLFSTLGISELSPQSLLQLCCHLHSITPDLSYAHSFALVNSLFLDRALSLTSPAPRPLLAALSMFCMKYARSACNVLIGPLLLMAETGSAQIDFLCRMVSECLLSEQLPLSYGPVLEVPLCEGSLTVLHTLLEKQAIPSSSEFELLLLTLSNTAGKFSKSVIFSKLLLTIINRNQNMILPSHLGPLTNALTANQTFLKKSLQGALKKVQDSIT